MPLVEYKTIKFPDYLQTLITIIGLFIPLPIEKYTPDFTIAEYGFASTISVKKIPLMWFVIIIALIF